MTGPAGTWRFWLIQYRDTDGSWLEWAAAFPAVWDAADVQACVAVLVNLGRHSSRHLAHGDVTVHPTTGVVTAPAGVAGAPNAELEGRHRAMAGEVRRLSEQVRALTAAFQNFREAAQADYAALGDRVRELGEWTAEELDALDPPAEPAPIMTGWTGGWAAVAATLAGISRPDREECWCRDVEAGEHTPACRHARALYLAATLFARAEEDPS